MVKGKLYLFGGVDSPQAGECLPGVYCFDIGKITGQGVAGLFQGSSVDDKKELSLDSKIT